MARWESSGVFPPASARSRSPCLSPSMGNLPERGARVPRPPCCCGLLHPLSASVCHACHNGVLIPSRSPSLFSDRHFLTFTRTGSEEPPLNEGGPSVSVASAAADTASCLPFNATSRHPSWLCRAIKMSPTAGQSLPPPPDTPVRGGGGLKQLNPCCCRSRGNVSNWLQFVGGLISVLLSWITWK